MDPAKWSDITLSLFTDLIVNIIVDLLLNYYCFLSVCAAQLQIHSNTATHSATSKDITRENTEPRII